MPFSYFLLNAASILCPLVKSTNCGPWHYTVFCYFHPLVQIFSSEPSLKLTESMFMYLACQTSKLYTNFPLSHILTFADSFGVHIPFCQSEKTVLIIYTLSHDTVSYQLLKLGCWHALGSCISKVVREVISKYCNWLWCGIFLGQPVVIHIVQKFFVFPHIQNELHGDQIPALNLTLSWFIPLRNFRNCVDIHSKLW